MGALRKPAGRCCVLRLPPAASPSCSVLWPTLLPAPRSAFCRPAAATTHHPPPTTPPPPPPRPPPPPPCSQPQRRRAVQLWAARLHDLQRRRLPRQPLHILHDLVHLPRHLLCAPGDGEALWGGGSARSRVVAGRSGGRPGTRQRRGAASSALLNIAFARRETVRTLQSLRFCAVVGVPDSTLPRRPPAFLPTPRHPWHARCAAAAAVTACMTPWRAALSPLQGHPWLAVWRVYETGDFHARQLLAAAAGRAATQRRWVAGWLAAAARSPVCCRGQGAEGLCRVCCQMQPSAAAPRCSRHRCRAGCNVGPADNVAIFFGLSGGSGGWGVLFTRPAICRLRWLRGADCQPICRARPASLHLQFPAWPIVPCAPCQHQFFTHAPSCCVIRHRQDNHEQRPPAVDDWRRRAGVRRFSGGRGGGWRRRQLGDATHSPGPRPHRDLGHACQQWW